MSPEHLRLMEEYAGQGVSTRRRDYVDFEIEGEPWSAALFEWEHGEPEPLLDLLSRDYPFPPEFRHWLTHIVDKYRLALRKGKGRRKAPYIIHDLKLRNAAQDVRTLMRNGMSAHDAEEFVAKRKGLSQETLHTYRRGGHASAWRLKKRRGE
jgi:hypothetical protein